jgi:hypothetical protein
MEPVITALSTAMLEAAALQHGEPRKWNARLASVARAPCPHLHSHAPAWQSPKVPGRVGTRL